MFLPTIFKVLPVVVDVVAGEVVLIVVVSSVVVPKGVVTTFFLVTLTLLGAVDFGWSLNGSDVTVVTSTF